MKKAPRELRTENTQDKKICSRPLIHGHKKKTMDCGLWTMDCGPWTMDRGLWTIDCGLWTVDRLATWNLRFFVRYLLVAIYYFLFILSLNSCIYAAFNDFGTGAKTLGLAGTYTAIGNDIYSPFYNPAGLSFLKRGQFAFEYGKLHFNLTDGSNIYNGFIGVAYPFIKKEIIETQKTETRETVQEVSGSTLTITEPVIKIETSIRRTLSSALMIGYKTLALDEVYSENILQITYSRFFGKYISVGLTFKSLSDKFTIDKYLENSEVFDNGQRNTKSAFTFDTGVVINPLPQFYLGAAALNINEPDMGYRHEDKVSAIYKIGFGLRKGDSKFGFDATQYNKTQHLEFSCGVEKTYGIFDLRGAILYGERAKNAGIAQIATGFSIRPTNSISIDYAINYPLSHLKDTYGSHWLSFVLNFGPIPSEELEPGSLERAYIKIIEEKAELENKLASVEKEKRKLEEVLIEEATARIRERIKQAKEKDVRPAEPKTTPAPAPAAPKTAMATRTHIVQKGDTLQSLAEKYYNDSKLWIEIYNANKDNIGRGGALKPNQVLIIPPLSAPISRAPAAPPTIKPAEPSSAETKPPIIAPTPPAEPITPKVEKVETEKIVPLIQPTTEATTPQPQKEKAKPLPSRQRIHTVKAGENLRTIAEKYYNNPEKWKDILEANKNQIIRGQVRPGMELIIP